MCTRLTLSLGDANWCVSFEVNVHPRERVRARLLLALSCEFLPRRDQMNAKAGFADYVVGYDIPALPGMAEADIQTPCLILDLDALERNIRKMGEYAKAHGMRHRSHGKMHKSVDVQKLQESLGGAAGICCQKVSEAEVFARGGIRDILVSNEVRDPVKIDRLAQLPKHGARIIVCVDDLANVAELSAAAQTARHDAGVPRRD